MTNLNENEFTESSNNQQQSQQQQKDYDAAYMSKGMFDGFFGCIRPFIHLWTHKATNLKSHLVEKAADFGTSGGNEDLEIPFEDLKDLQWVGSGAQGCVFKGTLNGQLVAIKKVKSKEEANIRHLKRLNNPNLVKFKGVSFNGDKFFCIIMEFCAHGQLYTHLSNLSAEKKFLKPSLMIDWLTQITNGMNYLHSNKIIHRDLKSPKYVTVFLNKIVKKEYFCYNFTSVLGSQPFIWILDWMDD
jgi:hypothetical protein